MREEALQQAHARVLQLAVDADVPHEEVFVEDLEAHEAEEVDDEEGWLCPGTEDSCEDELVGVQRDALDDVEGVAFEVLVSSAYDDVEQQQAVEEVDVVHVGVDRERHVQHQTLELAQTRDHVDRLEDEVQVLQVPRVALQVVVGREQHGLLLHLQVHEALLRQRHELGVACHVLLDLADDLLEDAAPLLHQLDAGLEEQVDQDSQSHQDEVHVDEHDHHWVVFVEGGVGDRAAEPQLLAEEDHDQAVDHEDEDEVRLLEVLVDFLREEKPLLLQVRLVRDQVEHHRHQVQEVDYLVLRRVASHRSRHQVHLFVAHVPEERLDLEVDRVDLVLEDDFDVACAGLEEVQGCFF